ncbi:MAG: ribbon-helix-helix protein, CopG family [Candidatus Nanopelagicales bacterium]
MSMNLRLSESLANGLKALSKETGKSQQVLVREAIAEYVNHYKLLRYPPEIRHLIIPAETEFGDFYVDQSRQVNLPPGVSADGVLQELRRDRY